MSDLLTVFTDASYCHETGAAGWAVWAKRDGRPTFFKAGSFRDKLSGPFEAELGAVANACAMLSRRQYLGGDHHVLIKTDCQEVIDRIGRFAQRNPEGVYERYYERIYKAKLSVRCLEIRHVKGHRGMSAGARFAVNERCDRAAKFQMRLKRKELL